MNENLTLLLSGLISILFGLLSCFFGWRVFRLVLTIAGFLGGFALGASLAPVDQQTLQLVYGLVAGIVGAVLAYVLFAIGVFVAGAGLGIVVGGAIGTLLGATNEVTLIIVVVCLVAGGLIALVLQKLMIIISTAFSGAGAIIAGAGLIFPAVAVLNNPQPESSAGVIAFVIWLVLGILGFSFQFRSSARWRREGEI